MFALIFSRKPPKIYNSFNNGISLIKHNRTFVQILLHYPDKWWNCIKRPWQLLLFLWPWPFSELSWFSYNFQPKYRRKKLQETVYIIKAFERKENWFKKKQYKMTQKSCLQLWHAQNIYWVFLLLCHLQEWQVAMRCQQWLAKPN